MQSSEKKKPKLIDRFDPCLKKKRRKKEINSLHSAHLFSGVVGVVGVSISDVVSRHSLSLPSRSRPFQFPSCGFYVFDSLRKRNNRIFTH